MENTKKAKSTLRFNELINWVTDYAENEIEFDIVCDVFEEYKTDYFSHDSDLFAELTDEQSQIFQSIDELFDQRILTLIMDDFDAPISEDTLKTKLIKILDNQTSSTSSASAF
ncbi:MAG: hypothetical protein RR531_11735 [Longicatena sp.]